MQILWYTLGSVNVLMWGFGLLLVQQIKKITILRKYDPPALTEPPLVSIIVAARGGMTWRGTVYSREKLNQK